MRLNYRLPKNGLIILAVCLMLCRFGFAQNNNDPLASFEKSVKEGRVTEIERPLLSYAVANPGNTKALKLLADVRFQQKRLAEAKGLYQRVLTLDPNAVSAKISLGRIASALGQKEEARQILNAAALSSIPAASQLELATALFFVGELQSAQQVIEKLPLKSRNGEALPLIAAIYLETGNKQKLNEMFPLMKKAATSPALAMQCAEVLQNAEMSEKSVELLRLALAAAPGNVDILVQLGRTEAYLQNFAQARQLLAQAERLQPQSAEILSAKALLEIAQNNLSAALDLLTQARKLTPSSTIVLADFVILAIRLNKTQMAVDAAKNLVSLAADNQEYKYLLGVSLLQNGNVMAAQEILENHFRERPGDSRGCLALGLSLAAQRDKIENARGQLNRCLELNPKNYEAKYQLGLSYKVQGETATAIRFFEETILIAPNYAPVLRDLGTLYLQTGAEAKAQTVLEKSVTLNPADADTHFQLSRLYNLSGKSELAKKHLEQFQTLRSGGKTSP